MECTMTKIFDGIMEGLNEMKKFMNGENTGATVWGWSGDDTKMINITKEYREKQKKELPNVKNIRKKYKLSQLQFAREFGLNVNTLKNWEHGVRGMDASTITLLKVIDKYPEIVKSVVNR